MSFRSRIGDLRMFSEFRRRGDGHTEPDDAAHPIQGTQLLLHERQHIEGGRVRRCPSRLHVQVLAHDANRGSRVARGGEHPAQEKEIARLDSRDVDPK